MAETKTVPRLTDKKVLALAKQILKKHHCQHAAVTIAGINPFNFSEEKYASILADLAKHDSFLISKITLHYSGYQVEYVRGGDQSNQRRASATLDEFKFENRGHGGGEVLSDVDRLSILRLVESAVEPGPHAGIFPNAPTEIEDLDAVYRSTVLRLENSFAEQIKKITDWTVAQTTSFEERKIKLTEETAAIRENLAAEHDARLRDLKVQEDELQERTKQLNDRDHMHVRRSIRTDMQKMIAAREAQFSLTSNTQGLRRPIHITMILLIVGLCAGNVVYFSTLNAVDFSAPIGLAVWVLIKQGALLAALIGAVFYYVRWMNRWFESHSTAEFMLKQFQLDFDRASWVVEAALEWRRNQQSDLPPLLAEGLTRNLFSNRDDGPDRATVRDDIASALLGSASQMRMKLGDSEVSFDRKGIAALADKPKKPS